MSRWDDVRKLYPRCEGPLVLATCLALVTTTVGMGIGCRAHPIPVTVVSPSPKVVRVVPPQECIEMRDIPEPPVDLEYRSTHEDVIVRTTVNMRDYNLMVRWAKDMFFWAWRAHNCAVQLHATLVGAQ